MKEALYGSREAQLRPLFLDKIIAGDGNAKGKKPKL